MYNVTHHPNRLVEWAELIISVTIIRVNNWISLGGRGNYMRKSEIKVIIDKDRTYGVNAFCAR